MDNKIVFYKVFVELNDGRVFYIDYANNDDAMSYFNGCQNNPRIKYIDVSRCETNNNGLIEPVEIIASKDNTEN